MYIKFTSFNDVCCRHSYNTRGKTFPQSFSSWNSYSIEIFKFYVFQLQILNMKKKVWENILVVKVSLEPSKSEKYSNYI